MPTGAANRVLKHLRQTVLRREVAGLSDGQLLECYLGRGEEAAFAALVRRHGPMVWGVCRRLLDNHHDTEDAFQATFLVFVRKAASIVPRDRVGNWLHGVAYHTALKARAIAARRRVREKQVSALPEPPAPEADLWELLQPVLDQELRRLPDIYRSALILCDLEGKTQKEAAHQLGCPEGTLAARLSRGRALLAKRLARQGVPLSAGALAALLTAESASASVPVAVVAATIHAASLYAAGTAGMISVQAVALMEGVLHTMMVMKLKIATAVLFVLIAAGAGTGGLIYHTQVQQAGEAQAANPAPDANEQPASGTEEQTRKALEAHRATAWPEEDTAERVQRRIDRFIEALYDKPDDPQTEREILAEIEKLLQKAKQAQSKDSPPEKNSSAAARDDKVWTLELKFQNPRHVEVTTPSGRKSVWYLRYEVSNPTSQPQTFIPDFELMTPREDWSDPRPWPSRHDVVSPKLQEAIARIEHPKDILGLKNSVTIATTPIPGTHPNAEPQRVAGIALWDNLSPDVPGFTLFISGLSNVYALEDDGVRRKTLELTFKKVGEEMRFVPPVQWLYPKEPSTQDAKAASLRALQEPGFTLLRDISIKTVKERIVQLEQQQNAGQKEKRVIEEMTRQWQELLKQEPAAMSLDRSKDRRGLLQAMEKELELGTKEEQDRQMQLKLLEVHLERLEKPPVQESTNEKLEGRVEQVSDKMLRLSVGTDHGVKKGDLFDIYRLGLEPLYFGKAEVFEVAPRTTFARLARPLTGKEPRAGDLATRNMLKR